MSAIQPVHSSARQRLSKGERIRPYNMEKARVPRECSEAMQRIALEIFTDCTNVGVPFQEALLAIYASGLQHGAALSKKAERNA